MSPSGTTYTAIQYRVESGSSLGIHFLDFFEDGVDSLIGERNYVRDDGTGSCAAEPITNCDNLEPGVYTVHAREVYFTDEDGSGDLSCGDPHLVVTSHAGYFELKSSPCECTLVPDVSVIPRGGSLGFQATVVNKTDQTGTVVFGTKVTGPHGGLSGYLFGPTQVSLTPYESRSKNISHIVPEFVQPGMYTYHGYVGNPGPVLYDECQFEFEVVAP